MELNVEMMSGMQQIDVLAEGSDCGAGSGQELIDIVFDPDTNGARAKAQVDDGNVVSVVILDKGSGFTAIPTATVDSESCEGVELRVVVDGIMGVHTTRAGAGYTSLPTITLSGGEGNADFEAAEVYARYAAPHLLEQLPHLTSTSYPPPPITTLLPT